MDDSQSALKIVRRMKNTGVEPGMTEAEFAAVQRQFALNFPPDLKALLATGLPVGAGWPNWRKAIADPHDEAARFIEARLSWPHEGLRFDVEHNSFWDPEWGTRPNALEEAQRIAADAINAAPKLIPIYGHRYLRSEPCTAGNPILSVYQMDIIVYGRNLHDYLLAERGSRRPELVDGARTIRCWTRWMLAEWEDT